ncbi:MAG TPA: ABC transporter permease [Ferruginibacter sp.]|nr:ABC transporter permease [Ferruginibacter sp.]HRO05229.1 ABC transporter permease [Ferruginibacter sp.]HRO95991.1 ABC transporter permease [Ferruginibacter sp.]HRP48675.1 ABC transporter permease [Ferruginibacter sp.]
MTNRTNNMISDKTVDKWDMVISGKKSMFQLNLKDIWNYRDLLSLLVRRDFVSFYKQTVLGPLWFFIQPFFTTVIFVIIFGNLAGISTDGIPQPLFYMTGVVMWNYFSECLLKTSTVFKDNANVFGKVYFPRLIMPLSIVVSNLIRFGVQLLMLIIVLVWFIVFENYSFNATQYILLLPYLVLIMAVLGLGFGMIISAMTTKYRDLTFLVTFGVQLLMYATPIIYPLSAAPEKYKSLISLNPMSAVIEGVRLGLLGRGEFTWGALLYVSLFSLFILITGMLVFNRVEKSFVDTI